MAKGKNNILAKVMPFLTGALVLAVALGAYFLLFLPRMVDLSGSDSTALAALEAQIVSDKAYVDELDAALERYRLLNTQLRQKTQTIIPLEVDIPGIFVQLDGIARKHNLLITAVSTANIEDEDEIGAQGQRLVKVTANIEGGDYRQFTVFLTDLERSVRLFDIQSVMFTPLSAKYAVTMKAYYIDPTIMAESADDGAPTQ